MFREMNIPWLLDSDTENLQKTVKQYKYQMDFLTKTNEGLIMTNRRLREDINDINTHYHELIVVSKEI